MRLHNHDEHRSQAVCEHSQEKTGIIKPYWGLSGKNRTPFILDTEKIPCNNEVLFQKNMVKNARSRAIFAPNTTTI